MKRNEFIKKTGLSLLALGVFKWPAMAQAELESNWAGNLTYHRKELFAPKTRAELMDVVKKIKNGKALGSKHSFNTVADTTESHISLVYLNKVLELDEKNGLVWVESGIRYGTLGKWLDARGYAIHNLASLPHISVMGASSTATHGSGDKNGNLSTAVAAIELIKADGTAVLLDESNPKFYGAVVSLGALGVVYKVALKIQKRFDATQHVYEGLPMSALKDNFDKIFGAGYSVSLFTHWLDKNINQVWIKRRTDQNYEALPAKFFGAIPATTNLHPIKANSAVSCTDQMGVPGPWYERLPHFKMEFTPSNGAELQSEFFVPRKHAYQAIMAIESMHKEIYPLLFVTELRSIAADKFWMSTAYGQDMIAIHFTWKPIKDGVMKILPKIEAKLKPFGGKPHWGKISTIKKEDLAKTYPKWNDFKQLRKEMDPTNKWTNDFLRNLGLV
ncbi:FAD-binding protein [Sandaracinomonas limnophila]|uniref:FAD-binding protein n=1 Tax=Sandaracinomonas limnophila TaxID=1862386 RepID=A0A437PXL0_9BACT|nr:D-arabinono-1,4-lactone oxidase [Sandaracinomonas limnophila]RVU27006.1 FAD-binding protein [Sandaracinomonas limnophila]